MTLIALLAALSLLPPSVQIDSLVPSRVEIASAPAALALGSFADAAALADVPGYTPRSDAERVGYVIGQGCGFLCCALVPVAIVIFFVRRSGKKKAQAGNPPPGAPPPGAPPSA